MTDRHLTNRLCTGLALLLAAIATACTPRQEVAPDAPPTLQAWAASDMVALTDRTARPDQPSLMFPRTEQVELFGAANETVSFQVVVDAANRPLEGLSIQPGTLSTADGRTISAERIGIWKMLPVEITDFPAWYLRLVDRRPQTARYYDALVPADARNGGQPWNVAPGERLALWVDLAIPRDARGGTYTGELKLTTANGATQSLPLSLELYDFVLPDARPLPALGAFDHRTLYERFVADPDDPTRPFVPTYLDPAKPKVAEGLDLIRQIMVLGHEHRLDLFDRQLAPKIRRDLYGELTLDWAAFDAVAKPYLDGTAFADRIGSPAWPIPYQEDYPVPRYYGGLDAQLYQQAAGQFVNLCGQHFRNLDADDRIFAWPLRDDVSHGAYSRLQAMAKVIRQTDRSIPVLSRLPVNPPAETQWQPPEGFEQSLDILAPPGQWLDPATAKDRRIPGQPLTGVWLSPGQPPYVPALSVVSTPADVRALPWLANKYDCAAIFLPEVLNWGPKVFQTSAGAETRLFYPGREVGVRGVLPSVRLKRLRRGMQDILYVWLLHQRERAGLAEMIVNAMVHYAGLDAVGDNYLDPRIGGWVQDGELWIRARRMLAEEIAAAIHPDAESDTQRVIEQVRWVRFLERTQELRVEQIHSAIRLLPPTPGEDLADMPRLAIDVQVELYNEFAHALPCRFRLAGLPEGWQSQATDEIPLPARSRQTVRLTATAQTLPPQYPGRIPLRLDIAWPEANRRSIELHVPYLIAFAAPQTPTIDGQLDDWPIDRGPGATRFQLLGKRGQSGSGLARRQTAAFVMQDRDYIYIALKCNEPNPAGMTVHRDNRIRYEQLLAVGEDLVEIVIDPTRQAQSPDDLLHFVVKPSGVLIQERGIGSQPPLGNVEPLAGKTLLAVEQGPDAWTVEMRIDRDAFGRDLPDGAWGINFARFATQGGEASNWAGAQRYYYNPHSLGTLFVPAMAPPPEAPQDRTTQQH